MKRTILAICIIIFSASILMAKNNRKARLYQRMYEYAYTYIMNDVKNTGLYSIKPNDEPFLVFPSFIEWNSLFLAFDWFPFDINDLRYDNVSKEPDFNYDNEKGFMDFYNRYHGNGESHLIIGFTRCKDNYFLAEITYEMKGWLKQDKKRELQLRLNMTSDNLIWLKQGNGWESQHHFNMTKVYRFKFDNRYSIVKVDCETRHYD